jgi:hypothetical protein
VLARPVPDLLLVPPPLPSPLCSTAPRQTASRPPSPGPNASPRSGQGGGEVVGVAAGAAGEEGTPSAWVPWGPRGARPQDRGAGRAARRPRLLPLLDPWPLPCPRRRSSAARAHPASWRPPGWGRAPLQAGVWSRRAWVASPCAPPWERGARSSPAGRWRASAWSGSRPLRGPWPWPNAPGRCLRPRAGRSAAPGTRARARWHRSGDPICAPMGSLRKPVSSRMPVPFGSPEISHLREPPRHGVRGGISHRLGHLPAARARNRGGKAPQGLGHRLAGFPPASRSARRAGKVREASPQRSGLSCVVTPSRERTLFCWDGGSWQVR